MRIAFAGGGAVGTPAALIAAKLLPKAEITLINRAPVNLGMRTFVLLASTQNAFADLGIWKFLKKEAHPLEQFDLSCAGMFGGTSFAAEDCAASAIGYSIGEANFIKAMQAELSNMANVSVVDATVEALEHSGKMSWEAVGKQETTNFDLVVIAGLPEQLLVRSGFSFVSKVYDQLVSVASFADTAPSNASTERLLTNGASILIPNAYGYGHVLIGSQDKIKELVELDDQGYLDMLRQEKHTPPPMSSTLLGRGSYVPKQRLALSASRGKLCLIGASACSVHPVGAQELNLGLRDAIALAKLLTEYKEIDENFASHFTNLRTADRTRIAQVTDLSAKFIGFDSKLKLIGTSLAATALDLVPMARRFALGKISLP